jgi:tetratricopeptide (TPR) repeat protein
MRHIKLQWWSGLCVLAIVIAHVGPAFAQDDDETGDPVTVSRHHFDRGVEYVQDGDLKAALIEFKRAYAASPNYRVLYNLGQVSNELREYIEAQSYFRRYLTDGGDEIDASRRRDVEAMLTKLSSRIARLELSSNIEGAELFVDDVPVGRSPLTEPVRVSAGARLVTAAVPGRPPISRSVEAAGGDTLSVQLNFPPSAMAAEVASAPITYPRVHAESSGTSPVLWLGITSGALGIATGVMAYLAAKDASDYHDAVKTKTTARELQTLDDRATTKALVTDILLGATVAATTVTLIVAATSGGEREHAASKSANARLSVGPGAVSLAGNF